MLFSSGEKRKNDAPYRFPWWLLLLGFIAGVLVTLILVGPQSQTVVLAPAPDHNLTVEANKNEQASNQLDAFQITATYLVGEATAAAATVTAQAGS